MARRRVNTTKYEIIRVATKLFLEQGYSNTTPHRICEELDISTGNLTYYFPTKDHLLNVLVEMLCAFQWKMVRDAADHGQTSLLAVCMELATMIAAGEQSPIAKDLFVASYSSPACLRFIQQNDMARSKQVYAEFCEGWDDERHAEAEMLVSGIEYASLMADDDTVSLEMRISGALNSIMLIYGVPQELRHQKIEKVLATDYRTLGERVFAQFREFVEQASEQPIEELLGK